jgi:hypothetical protein
MVWGWKFGEAVHKHWKKDSKHAPENAIMWGVGMLTGRFLWKINPFESEMRMHLD